MIAHAHIDIRRQLDPRVMIQRWDSRDQWLGGRLDGLGASEVAMALGVSTFGTPFSLWEKKMAPLATEKRGAQLSRGHRWEPTVLAEYEDESGLRVLDPRASVGCADAHAITMFRKDLPMLRQTPDAFAITPRTGEIGQVEAKTAVQSYKWTPHPGVVIDRWDDSYAELVPAQYAIQGYAQLIVSGLPWVDLCALVPVNMWLSVRWVRLMRDEETQGQLEEAIRNWWQRHIVEKIPPEIDGSEPCNRYLAAAFPSPSGKKKPERQADESEADLLSEMYEINQRAKADAERKDLIRNLLLERAKGERLTLPSGAYGQPQNNKGASRVDLDELRKEAPELVTKHTKPGTPFVTFNLYRFAKKEGTES